jgi:hypothetical protein
MHGRSLIFALVAALAGAAAVASAQDKKKDRRDRAPAEPEAKSVTHGLPPVQKTGLPVLMPEGTADEMIAKIRALAARYRPDPEDFGPDRRQRAAALQECVAELCRRFQDKWPEHPRIDYVRALHVDAYMQMVYLVDQPQVPLGLANRLILDITGGNVQLARTHPLGQYQQLRNQIRQFTQNITSIGSFRDGDTVRRNGLITNLLRYADRYPGQPGMAGLLLEFARMFHEAELPAQAESLLARLVKHWPDSWEAEHGAKLLEEVRRSLHPVELKFADAAGKAFDLAKYRGRVTILVFWTPGSPGAGTLAARVETLVQRYGESDRLAAVGFAQGGDAEALKATVADAGITWAQFLDHADDGKSAAAALGVVKTPRLLLLDHQGRLRHSGDGGNLEAEVFHLITVQRSKKE